MIALRFILGILVTETNEGWRRNCVARTDAVKRYLILYPGLVVDDVILKLSHAREVVSFGAAGFTPFSHFPKFG
jgi:hypothetical protein